MQDACMWHPFSSLSLSHGSAILLTHPNKTPNRIQLFLRSHLFSQRNMYVQRTVRWDHIHLWLWLLSTVFRSHFDYLFPLRTWGRRCRPQRFTSQQIVRGFFIWIGLIACILCDINVKLLLKLYEKYNICHWYSVCG